jgi:hypothetical protein
MLVGPSRRALAPQGENEGGRSGFRMQSVIVGGRSASAERISGRAD